MPKFEVHIHNREGAYVGRHVLRAPTSERALVAWKDLVLDLVMANGKLIDLMGMTPGTRHEREAIKSELETFTWTVEEYAK